jgi:MazG family protein
MESFDTLIQIADRLLAPDGCPWDQKQTFASLQAYVLEEAHEVIEAVDLNDADKMVEELGDLLYLVIFYGKLGEKKGAFCLSDIIEAIKEKMIRRHPHIFGDVKVQDADEVKRNWEKIKAQEKPLASSVLEGIPPTLPSVIRAQKGIQRMNRALPGFLAKQEGPPLTEEEVGERLFHLILLAEQSGVDAESCLRRFFLSQENAFRQEEDYLRFPR